MDIIFVADHSGKVRTIRVTKWLIVLAGITIISLMAVPTLSPPEFFAASRQLGDTQKPRAFDEQNPNEQEQLAAETLGLLVAKLGELQSKLARLDSRANRLAQLAGLHSQEFRFSEAPGRGGPLMVRSGDADPVAAMTKRLDELSNQINDRSDKLTLLDQVLREHRVRQQSRPTKAPILGARPSSGFGNRIDPFTGQTAFHAGLDFLAPPGSDIAAAAGGVVVAAESHLEYGNMIEIDHGNGLSTRYGHASVLSVKVGDIVMQGQKIAEVGSTGRSTGPHLHFEIRDNEAAVNPIRYLQKHN